MKYVKVRNSMSKEEDTTKSFSPESQDAWNTEFRNEVKQLFVNTELLSRKLTMCSLNETPRKFEFFYTASEIAPLPPNTEENWIQWVFRVAGEPAKHSQCICKQIRSLQGQTKDTQQAGELWLRGSLHSQR